MSRHLALGFAGLVYIIFLITFVYLIAFTGDLFVSKTVDRPSDASGAIGVAAVINLGLIALFGVQHSVMARPGFKAWFTRIIPAAAERSMYVLMSSILLMVLFAFWQPMPSVIWSVTNEIAVTVIWALFAIGWVIALVSTYLINHFQLFGLSQAWHGYRGTEPAADNFRTPLFYKATRHPLYLGMLIGLWAIPEMTLGHLVFAGGMTAYVLVGIHYEERDLISGLGDAYTEYRRRVGMLIPGFGRAR